MAKQIWKKKGAFSKEKKQYLMQIKDSMDLKNQS